MLSAWSIRCETQPHRRMSSHNVGLATHITSGRKSASPQGRKPWIANKKNEKGRKLDNARTHAQGGASPTPPQCKGGEWKGAVHSLQGL